MIYDQQITLEQATDLQIKIKAGEMPDIIAFSTSARKNNSLEYTDINYVYKYRGKELLLTRSDYDTYIIAESEPSIPAHFTYQNDDWLREANKVAVEYEELKAKYEALEGTAIATAILAEARKTTINQQLELLEGAKEQSKIAEDYISALIKKLMLLNQLQAAEIEINKASFNYYSF